MIDFSQLKIIKHGQDNFVGIRKSSSQNEFEFYLPNGFDNFPEDNYIEIKNLFFNLYRTFRKFERDNTDSSRFDRNEHQDQNTQDDITISSGGISLYNEDGEVCILYSKIQMIEKVLDAYDDLTIQSIQYKNRRTEEIDYSQIHRYLERAIYLDSDTIYVESMDLPCPIIKYDSTNIVQLYCYILYEIVQQLDRDVGNNIKARISDIKFLAESFQDRYLTANQSLFNQDTYLETINILKDTLDIIDKNTFYKDGDYWQLYEAIEIFLYGEIDPNQNDGEYWGIKGFSYVWEDICHSYFFTKYNGYICFADTDIPLKNYNNEILQRINEKDRVGNIQIGYNQWIYSLKSHVNYPQEIGCFGWNELLCIEFNKEPGILVYSNEKYSDFKNRIRTKADRRFPRPDLILNIPGEENYELWIIDFKNVALEFYIQNRRLPFNKPNEKYRIDIIKQLAYELALQQSERTLIKENWFLIPYYYSEVEERDFFEPENQIHINGIKVVQGNFTLMLKNYIE